MKRPMSKQPGLSAVAQGNAIQPIGGSTLEAVQLLLGTMVGGYNVAALIELLKHQRRARLLSCAVQGLSRTLLGLRRFQ